MTLTSKIQPSNESFGMRLKHWRIPTNHVNLHVFGRHDRIESMVDTHLIDCKQRKERFHKQMKQRECDELLTDACNVSFEKVRNIPKLRFQTMVLVSGVHFKNVRQDLRRNSFLFVTIDCRKISLQAIFPLRSRGLFELFLTV